MSEAGPTLHASCVSVGGRGVLIRGASGAGKSHLAFALILAGRSGLIPPTVLVADDRVFLERRGNGLVARAPAALAGLIEVRGAGLYRIASTEEAAVDLVIDLDAADAARLPADEARRAELCGVNLPRLAVWGGGDPLHQVVAALLLEPFTDAD